MTDAAISRSLDLIWAFPVYLLAVALATSLAVGGLRLGPLHVAATSLLLPIVVIAVVYIPYVARPIRGQVLGLRRRSSSTRRSRRAPGRCGSWCASSPNVASIALVLMTLIIANNILTEAALSLLGVGVPVLTPSWGKITQQGYSSIVTAPALTVAPGIAIMLTVVSLNVLGDALATRSTRTRGSGSAADGCLHPETRGRPGDRALRDLRHGADLAVIPGGDPALRIAGRHPTQQNIKQIRKDWGFDRPLVVQYVDMMDRLFVKRDLISYQDQTQVIPTIERGIPHTLSLACGQRSTGSQSASRSG